MKLHTLSPINKSVKPINSNQTFTTTGDINKQSFFQVIKELKIGSTRLIIELATTTFFPDLSHTSEKEYQADNILYLRLTLD